MAEGHYPSAFSAGDDWAARGDIALLGMGPCARACGKHRLVLHLYADHRYFGGIDFPRRCRGGSTAKLRHRTARHLEGGADFKPAFWACALAEHAWRGCGFHAGTGRICILLRSAAGQYLFPHGKPVDTDSAACRLGFCGADRRRYLRHRLYDGHGNAVRSLYFGKPCHFRNLPDTGSHPAAPKEAERSFGSLRAGNCGGA